MTTICLPTPHARALRPLRNLRPPLLSPFLAAAVLLIAAAAPAVAGDRRAGISTETLVKSATAWDQTGYTAYPSGTPEPTLLRVTLAPNTRLDWHTHPMPAIGYVASGHLTVERADNGTQRAFVAGQTVTELVDIPHRGWSGDAGAELLVFYAGSVQQPLFIVSPGTKKLAQDETAKTSRD